VAAQLTFVLALETRCQAGTNHRNARISQIKRVERLRFEMLSSFAVKT
jgi:hypothetical protein